MSSKKYSSLHTFNKLNDQFFDLAIPCISDILRQELLSHTIKNHFKNPEVPCNYKSAKDQQEIMKKHIKSASFKKIVKELNANLEKEFIRLINDRNTNKRKSNKKKIKNLNDLNDFFANRPDQSEYEKVKTQTSNTLYRLAKCYKLVLNVDTVSNDYKKHIRKYIKSIDKARSAINKKTITNTNMPVVKKDIKEFCNNFVLSFQETLFI